MHHELIDPRMRSQPEVQARVVIRQVSAARLVDAHLRQVPGLDRHVRRDGRREEQLTWSDALLVGIAQGCAVMPGISRSGATISTLLIKGVEGETAARFSFLLALPAVFGAALLSLRDVSLVAATEIPAYCLGTAAAFGIGFFSIHFLLGVIRRRRLTGFAVYCWLVGGAFLAAAAL